MRKITLQNWFLGCILLACFCSYAQTAVWTGAVNTKWNTPANWALGVVPTLQTSVEIPVVTTGNYPVVTNEDGIADCNNLTVASGANLLVDHDGYGTLRIAGSITNNGIINATKGTIVLMGTLPQVIPANVFATNTVHNLTVYNILGVTLQGALSVTGILDVKTGIFNTNNALTLKSTATATAIVAKVTGVIVGEVVVERYIPARRGFRFISPSTTGGTISSNWQEGAPSTDPTGFGTDITGTGGATNGFDVSGSNNPSLFTHNNTTATWEAVTSTLTPLTAGTAYRLLVRGDRTIDLTSNAAVPTNTTLRTTGTLTTGNVIVTNLNANAGGFSFIGNPYQAPVAMDEVLTDTGAYNLNTDYYYVWDPTLNTRGAYVTVNLPGNYNSNAGSAANKYLQPNQAFFVQTEFAGPAYLTFKEEHKYTVVGAENTPNLYRTTGNTAQIKAVLFTTEALAANAPAADGFVINFNDSYSNALDGKDAVKPVNQDENTGILNAGQTLSIESRALPVTTDVISIANTAYRSAGYTYKMSVTGLDNVDAYLHDKFTGTMTLLENGTETAYSFAIDGQDANSSALNRFDIVFKEKALGTNNLQTAGISLYPNPATGNAFTLQLHDANNPSVQLYNQLGQQIACNTALSSGNAMTVTPQLPLAAGIYIVKAINNGTSYTQKLIVKN